MQKEKILIIDDEESIRQSLASVLEDDGFVTSVAENGQEGISKIKSFNPDVVFLDIWMPGWDGIETLDRIKEASPEIEVIMISGHATIANALEATKRGAFDFIEKPLHIDSVLLSTNRALQKKQIDQYTSSIRETNTQKKPELKLHEGILSEGSKGKNIGQRTLKRSAILYGHCLHTGQKSGLILEPLPLNSGIHFSKIGESRTIPAFVSNVLSTGFATTIHADGIRAATIEHLLAALHAYKISNLLIKCNDEVPIFDGSAIEFCKAIEEVGIEEQGGDWYEVKIPSEITVVTDEHSSKEVIKIEPSDTFQICYELSYPDPVGFQSYTFTLDSIESFKNEIAPNRTFGFMKDIERLQKAGLAAGGRLDNFILIGNDGVVNTQLRFENELARHKILDVIGDLFLIGRPLCGKITAKMTGHSDNITLLKKVLEHSQ